ncbi:MAG: sigma-70 family RNA polymerase sigma factor, partial [Verrucomicrobia bacterium]|nr:sigma-70 family RNA polymerase sigma factor [Verrucomicrobiota bacterium]
LMKAVERFDPKKGGKLSTYAAWWIKQSIKRALANQSKTIRLPVHMVDKIAKMRRIATLLTEAMGHEPTDDELADEIGVPRRKLAMLRQASHRPTSLNSPINEGEATEYGEVISDEHAINPLDMLTDKNIHAELEDLLDVLDERERRIRGDSRADPPASELGSYQDAPHVEQKRKASAQAIESRLGG